MYKKLIFEGQRRIQDTMPKKQHQELNPYIEIEGNSPGIVEKHARKLPVISFENPPTTP